MAQLFTQHPIALESPDHLFPRGTANDDTHRVEFVLACERVIGKPLLVMMDLGCAGGGLVEDFLRRGHIAYGVEGSDYSLLRKRAAWGKFPENLGLADVTKPFRLMDDTGKIVWCDVISAWEFLEHIAEEDLPQVFNNVLAHLAPEGIFVGSVSCERDELDGHVWHQTVRPKDWWVEQFVKNGLEIEENHGFLHEEYARGNGNGPGPDYREQPDAGFHFVARRA